MDAARIALNRFGLGKRPFDRAPADPKGWLETQLTSWRPGLAGADGLATRAAIVEDIANYRAMRQAAMRQAAGRQAPGRAAADDAATAAAAKPDVRAQIKDQRRDVARFARQQYVAQVGVRTRSAVMSDAPFAERLVHFWANHFAVSADKLVVIGLAGLLEFEGVRPNIMGRFADLLLAVEQHPAMLLYLDQAQSVGPGSPLGQSAGARRRKLGLNENLGREILELHTLGVRTGYSQADVTELARALTGWTVAGLALGPVTRLMPADAAAGAFVFVGPMHEPGARTILGKSYAAAGEEQARAVLADLARSPATIRHVTTKLARHFVADDPPPALVARMEAAWRASDGNLIEVYRAMIAAPEAWHPEPAKFRNPWLWSVAVLRALQAGPGAAPRVLQDRPLAGAMAELGQPVWRPGSPAGFDDIAASWAGPGALYGRVAFAGRIAALAPPATDPRSLAAALFGDGLAPATAQAIARAESPAQGLSLLFVAPEMLRC